MPGTKLAVCVTEDGRADLVIITTALIDDDQSTYNPTTPEARHEQPGPLPEQYARRITHQPGAPR